MFKYAIRSLSHESLFYETKAIEATFQTINTPVLFLVLSSSYASFLIRIYSIQTYIKQMKIDWVLVVVRGTGIDKICLVTTK